LKASKKVVLAQVDSKDAGINHKKPVTIKPTSIT
jgi:hypothetical protein